MLFESLTSLIKQNPTMRIACFYVAFVLAARLPGLSSLNNAPDGLLHTTQHTVQDGGDQCYKLLTSHHPYNKWVEPESLETNTALVEVVEGARREFLSSAEALLSHSRLLSSAQESLSGGISIQQNLTSCVVGLLESAHSNFAWAEAMLAASHSMRQMETKAKPHDEANAEFSLQMMKMFQFDLARALDIHRGNKTDAVGNRIAAKQLKLSHMSAKGSILLSQPLKHGEILNSSQKESVKARHAHFVPASTVFANDLQATGWISSLAWSKRLLLPSRTVFGTQQTVSPSLLAFHDSFLPPAWLPAERWLTCIDGNMMVKVVDFSDSVLFPQSTLGSASGRHAAKNILPMNASCSQAMFSLDCIIRKNCSVSRECVTQQILSAYKAHGGLKPFMLRPGQSLRVSSDQGVFVSSVQDANSSSAILLQFFTPSTQGHKFSSALLADASNLLDSDPELKSVRQSLVDAKNREIALPNASTENSVTSGSTNKRAKQRRKRWKRRNADSVQLPNSSAPVQEQTSVKIGDISYHSANVHIEPKAAEGARIVVAKLLTSQNRVFRASSSEASKKNHFPPWMIEQPAGHFTDTSRMPKDSFAISGLEPGSWYAVWRVPEHEELFPAVQQALLFKTRQSSVPGKPKLVSAMKSFSPIHHTVNITWSMPDDAGGLDLLGFSVFCSADGQERLGHALILQPDQLHISYLVDSEEKIEECFVRAINQHGIGPRARAQAEEVSSKTHSFSQPQNSQVATSVFNEIFADQTSKNFASILPVGSVNAMAAEAVEVVLRHLCQGKSSRVCSMHRKLLSSAVPAPKTEASGTLSQFVSAPSHGPYIRFSPKSRHIEVLRKLQPHEIVSFSPHAQLHPRSLVEIIAQSIVAVPLNLDVQAAISSSAPINAYLWPSKVVIGASSDQISPAQQIHVAAAQGARALVVVDLSGPCETKFGCWIHDFHAARSSAQEAGLHVVLLSRSDGETLLQMTNSKWLAVHT